VAAGSNILPGMDVGDPLAEAEARLQAMIAGDVDGISPAQAQTAVEAVTRDRKGGLGGRSLGFAVIQARPLYEGGDWQEFVVAVSDGGRNAAILARLSGSLAKRAAGHDDAAQLFIYLQGFFRGRD
jgi:hypothetical protein